MLVKLINYYFYHINTLNIYILCIILLTTFIITISIGYIIFPILVKLNCKQIGRCCYPKSHKKKNNTPTMGGIIINIAIILSIFLWIDYNNVFIQYITFLLIGYSIIGFIDDYYKIRYNNTQGLSAIKKYLWQSILSVIVIICILTNNTISYKLLIVIPFIGYIKICSWLIFAIFSYLIIVGTSNAVNLTDGLDGLVIVPIIFTSIGLLILSFITSSIKLSKYFNISYINLSSELVVLCMIIIGVSLGFLWFNCYPAKLFMGDVGSIPLGGVIGLISVLIHQESLLLIMGGFFFVETISVIIQIIFFKIIKKRIFLMAPIHHHFELKGYKEQLIVVRVWIICFILLILSLMQLKYYNNG
ncbi:MAG: phospho-N-acetylmuramoyl-pentapeptide-transferase [Candidatus Lightella neohaematopini]|nr:phospho-N-acetylmuramoyl-pentapeptide-transferase [Candidatus Lightella neohaematopini]